jgi:hypothetical protein
MLLSQYQKSDAIIFALPTRLPELNCLTLVAFNHPSRRFGIFVSWLYWDDSEARGESQSNGLLYIGCIRRTEDATKTVASVNGSIGRRSTRDAMTMRG